MVEKVKRPTTSANLPSDAPDQIGRMTSPARKAMCKELYFRGLGSKQIQKIVGVPAGTIDQWIYGSIRPDGKRWVEDAWKYEREVYWEDKWKELRKMDETRIKAILSRASDYILSQLETLLANGEDASPRDIKLISDLVANFDRIGRLEEGKPTQHIQQGASRSVEEIIAETLEHAKRLQDADPMYVDIEEHGSRGNAPSKPTIN